MNKGKSFLVYPWLPQNASVVSKYLCWPIPLSASEVGLTSGWPLWPSLATGEGDITKPLVDVVALSSNKLM
jgi:hypothetical protein